MTKEEKVARFARAVSQTWKPNNRVRQPFYTSERQLEPKHPVLFGPEWSDIELFLRDCPWRFQNYSSWEHAQRGEKWGRAMGRPVYDCLHTGTIAEIPLERIASKNAILLDWVTFPKINEAIEAVEFRRNKNGNPIWTYKACPFVWVKTTPNGEENFYKAARLYKNGRILEGELWMWLMGLLSLTEKRATWEKSDGKIPGLWHKGNGFYSMANVEVCLLYTKGSPSFRVNKDVGSLIIEPVGSHSSKPKGIYDKIDRLFGAERKRAELFARKSNPPPDGWLATGLEYDGMDIAKALGMDRRFWHENQPKFEAKTGEI